LEDKMGKVTAVCTSEKKGTQKTNCHTAVFREDWGIEGDAHAGKWHRQVSLLSSSRIADFRKKAQELRSDGGQPLEIPFGAFGENLAVEGIDFKQLPVGTHFYCNDVELVLTQIGKECHSGCEIFKKMGDCIMPREGVFARVLKGGTISEGDELTYRFPFGTAVVTVSDSGAAGKRKDESGPAICRLLEKAGYPVVFTTVVPDDRPQIENLLKTLADDGVPESDAPDAAIIPVHLVLTTGGTGFSPRDVTPEATTAVSERPVPGIPEAMRAASLKITPRAMLSRAVAGIRGETLIINLPGSPKACKENLSCITGTLQHALEILTGRTGNCARS
jgi:molybdenum cofactor synthesis domain-containing protein